MCNSKASDLIVRKKGICVDNEKAQSHLFLRKIHAFDANQPSHMPADSIPRLPQALDMVNQTVSIAQEPESSSFLQRNILEFPEPADVDLEKFASANSAKNDMRA